MSYVNRFEFVLQDKNVSPEEAEEKYAWKVYRAYIGMSDAKRQKLRDITS